MSLKISNLSKRFNTKWVLKDVSLEINQGEIFGLLGANGVGKSTLLNLIAGIESPNGGQISFNGNNLTKSSAKERSFNLITNQANSSWKNIFSSKKKIDSESETQIAEIQQTLQNSRGVVLLDNPFSAVNQNLIDKVFTDFKAKVAENKLCVIIAVNEDFTAFNLCDRVGILDDGEIIQTGPPREIYEHPKSFASANALGRNNFITARRISFTNDKSLEFHTLTGEHRLQTDKLDIGKLGAITQNVTLAIRPEYISISFGASFPEDNLLKAQIVGIEYCGATTRLKLDANGLILEALALRIVGLNIGDECMVGLPPDRILVLKN